MDRRKPTLRAWKAWTLFLLALVAVGAPVWANAYVCPMDRAARAAAVPSGHETACCSKAATLPPAAWGVDALEAPCDCAQLQWDVSDIDQPRASSVAAVAPAIQIAVPSPVSTLRNATVVRRDLSQTPLASASPPLWILNQSIRC